MMVPFRRRFAAYVQDRSKRHTIRLVRKNPIQVGDRLDCYLEPRRTPKGEKALLLGRFKCVRIEPIEIVCRLPGWAFKGSYAANVDFYAVFQVSVAGEWLTRDERDVFAWSDGFRHSDRTRRTDTRGCFGFMADYWLEDMKKRKLRWPFVGVVIHWE